MGIIQHLKFMCRITCSVKNGHSDGKVKKIVPSKRLKRLLNINKGLLQKIHRHEKQCSNCIIMVIVLENQLVILSKMSDACEGKSIHI